MKNNFKTEHRIVFKKHSFRRWVKQIFTSLLNRQNDDMEEILERLQDIKESVEIIAREMARQSGGGQ
jgi:DNA-binding transcriptional ArsR family regulator